MTIQIHGLKGFTYCETMGLSKCFKALADLCDKAEPIDYGIGFNENSGYVYIALEEGVTIGSMLGGDVEFLVTNFETGDESFHDTYSEALDQVMTNYHNEVTA
tara:strand:+ start:211 stop:519 length:309 start_codon:yes stop_codon:yes gene_type:complete